MLTIQHSSSSSSVRCGLVPNTPENAQTGGHRRSSVPVPRAVESNRKYLRKALLFSAELSEAKVVVPFFDSEHRGEKQHGSHHMALTPRFSRKTHVNKSR